MTADPAVVVQRAQPQSRLARGRRVATWHPEWWLVALVASAWALLALADLASVRDAAAAHHHGLAELGASPSAWAGEFAWSGVMATAMMAPLVLPQVHFVARTSLWTRVGRNQALFLAGYLGLWTLAILVIAIAIDAVRPLVGAGGLVALAFGAAVLWQVTPVKRRAVRRCARCRPAPPRGRPADVAYLRFGLVTGWSCLLTCWALMAAASAGGHGVLVMAGLFGIQLRERMRPRTSARRLAIGLALLGVAVLTWTLTVTS